MSVSGFSASHVGSGVTSVVASGSSETTGPGSSVSVGTGSAVIVGAGSSVTTGAGSVVTAGVRVTAAVESESLLAPDEGAFGLVRLIINIPPTAKAARRQHNEIISSFAPPDFFLFPPYDVIGLA